MHFLDEEHEWPESWTQMERLKFLSPDRRQFFKFEGMGPIGSEVRERAFALAAAGFSPAVADAGDQSGPGEICGRFRTRETLPAQNGSCYSA